ncbi:LLM class flavin-dependent oxidoreductase [Mycetocola reblochoni]|uniref:Nitrilotriacetate monooxygenase component A n=2 Tax=Mycetocola reblochoni TaxID=331618 RepID=A0A1R4IH60_9MICO|nr:LLM class flavin-dependent oxidoreductase [Mycetocola reblochoni]RLP68972.1 LLM class flavin-dependent oxidoreductase [Mycetocola reblochoni]SJN18713.1 nitrilotriacetate monooxygenase component A [Mycetocola reblochoni REB411]
MTSSPPLLLSLSGRLPALLREQHPALIEQLRRVAGTVGAVVIGAKARPLSLDPVAVATALTVRAPGLGLIVACDGVRDSPYNAARRLLSLDHLSDARSGVLFSSAQASAAQTAERIGVIRALWNSWPRRSLRADRERGVYANTEDIRRIDHVGEHYRVDGPLNSPSSRQGEPVSIWLVSSEAELRAAQGLVDLVLVEDEQLIERWREGDPAGRPALATGLDAAEAAVRVRTVGGLDELVALSDALATTDTDADADADADAADRATAPRTLRGSLELPARSVELSGKPLAFGAAL